MRTATPGPLRASYIAPLAMVAFVVLALHGAWENSATVDELVHLVSGWTALHWGDYRVNPEHPPLAKVVAALPVSSWLPDDPHRGGPPAGLTKAWASVSSLWNASLSDSAAQWYLAHEASFPMRDDWLGRLGVERASQVPTHIVSPPSAWGWAMRAQLFRARATMLLFPLLLSVALLVAGRHLASSGAAVFAVVLLAFDPSFIAHGALVTTDVAAAAAIFTSVAALWWWMRDGSWPGAAALALATGIAAVVKFTSIVLAPLFLLLLLGVLIRNPNRRNALRTIGALVIAATGAWTLIWMAYGFEWRAAGTGDRLDFEKLLTRRATISAILAQGGEVTGNTIDAKLQSDEPRDAGDAILRTLHESHLLPEAYTYGLAHVRAFAAPRAAMLNGEHSDLGFRSYFLWTFLYKTPLVVLLGTLVAAFAAIRGWISFQQLWWLLVPLLVLFAFASASGINIGHRHLLTIYPFLWLLIGHAVHEATARHRRRGTLRSIFVLLAVLPAFLAVSLNGVHWMPGNHIAFMNAVAGGPIAGSERLTDSNVDWGQDAYRLLEWWNAQEPRPLMAYAAIGATDPRAIQLPVLNTRLGYPFAPVIDIEQVPPGALLVVSRTSRSGVLDDPSTRERFRSFLSRYVIIDRVGYGLEIYAPTARR